jgi:metal-responsive CopG/Arc/MetJ family transcriptional regulator
MKTAVSIPDELFHRADALARKRGTSRSQLYQEALAEYLLRRDGSSITEAMNAVIDEVGPDVDPWVDAVSRRTLERTEW